MVPKRRKTCFSYVLMFIGLSHKLPIVENEEGQGIINEKDIPVIKDTLKFDG